MKDERDASFRELEKKVMVSISVCARSLQLGPTITGRSTGWSEFTRRRQ